MPSLAIHNSSSSFSGFIPSHFAYSITSAKAINFIKTGSKKDFQELLGIQSHTLRGWFKVFGQVLVLCFKKNQIFRFGKIQKKSDLKGKISHI
jgi:hypothetical protein